MSLLESLNGLLAPLLTGAVGIVVVLVLNWYHNKKMREYGRRQAEALEKIAGGGDDGRK